MKTLSYIFLLIFFFKSSFSFNPHDCSYEPATYHVQYICDVETGANFNRKTYQTLYCSNYSLGINRANIRILTFINCKRQKLANEYFDVFPSLRVLNISNTDIESIYAYDLKFSKFLEEFIASHNQLTSIPMDLFSHTSELISLNFSHNQILQLDPFVFDNVRKLKTIDFSFNSIEELNKRLFSNLPDLEYLDFSSNRIYMIDSNLLSNNKKLNILNLNNNHVEELSCDFLMKLANASTLEVSINTLKSLENGCSNENTHFYMNISISPDEPTTTLKIAETQFKWTFSSIDFVKLRHLNFSSGQTENISMIIQKASPQLESLDLSNNFIGELTDDTFSRFVNLKRLYLSRTNLSNFQFATFYHQRNLEVLDISYNNLNKIDFYLFLRNFQHLKSLDLEGNNLTEIDSITRTHFPNLSILAISKNNFTCDYLVKFLLQWHDLVLVDNPSNQINMGGVDCFHRNSTVDANAWNSNQSIAQSSSGQIPDLFLTNILLILTVLFLSIFLIFFGMLIFGQCQRVKNIYKRKFENEPMESAVVSYQKDLNEVQLNNHNHLNVFS